MELTIIQHNGGAYIDSREVAEAIGKAHKNLLRDITGYIAFMRKSTKLIFEPSDFFVESTYKDSTGRFLPCYLLSKLGCELCANKLIGEKGVLFTAAYVTKFNRMEQAEHEREVEALKKQAVTPRLAVFNKAIRTVMGGLNYADVSVDFVMKFLQDSYRPFGIEVADVGSAFSPQTARRKRRNETRLNPRVSKTAPPLFAGCSEQSRFYSVGTIARALGVYSYYGNPHAHAVSAIIDKLDVDLNGHCEIAPYGLVGFSVRYDVTIAEAVQDWLIVHGKPHHIPHSGFEYHIVYNADKSAFGDNGGGDYEDEAIDLDDDDFDIFSISDEEIEETCRLFGDCDVCPCYACCPAAGSNRNN